MSTAASKLWIFVLIFCLIGTTYAAIDIELEIDLSEDAIDTGDSFTINGRIENTDSGENMSSGDDIEVSVYFNDELVYVDDSLRHGDIDYGDSETFTVKASAFENWDEGLLFGYMCDDDIEVSVQLTGDVSASESADITLEGSELKVYLDPEEPRVDEDLEITVVDTVGNEISGANVRLTKLGDNGEWDEDDDLKTYDTDSDGTLTIPALSTNTYFKTNPYSKYRLDVWKDNYCIKTLEFAIENSLKITEVPQTVYAGEEVQVKVLDMADNRIDAAKVTISGKSSMVGSYSTDDRGYASFSIANPGSYTLLASKKNYGNSDAISLTVSERKGTSISVSPDKQSVGKDITITVTSDGKALSGAEVSIKRPDGKTDVRTTSTSGKVTYSPDSYGSYELIVEKEGYSPAEASFEAVNMIDVVLSKNPKVFENIELTAKNQDGDAIGGASVILRGADVSGSTDSSGKFGFEVDEAGEYTLEVKKDGFESYSEKITIYAVLEAAADPETLDLGDPVTISVKNIDGDAVEATIKLTYPDGRTENIKKSSHTFTPELAGEYAFNATRSYYLSVEGTFYVNPDRLELNAWLSGSDLVIKTTSNGKIASGVSVKVFTPAGDEKSLVTDAEGLARLDIKALNQTGAFTVKAEDRNYETKSLEKEINGFGSNLLPMIGIALFLLVVLAAVLGATLYLSHRHSKKSASVLGGPKKKGRKGSGLGRV